MAGSDGTAFSGAAKRRLEGCFAEVGGTRLVAALSKPSARRSQIPRQSAVVRQNRSFWKSKLSVLPMRGKWSLRDWRHSQAKPVCPARPSSTGSRRKLRQTNLSRYGTSRTLSEWLRLADLGPSCLPQRKENGASAPRSSARSTCRSPPLSSRRVFSGRPKRNSASGPASSRRDGSPSRAIDLSEPAKGHATPPASAASGVLGQSM